MDWKQEVFKRLDALGEKLGVAAGHVWQVLVRQSIAEGISSLVLAILCMAGLVVAIKVILWAQKTGSANKDFAGDWPGNCIFWFSMSIAGTMLSTVGLFVNIYEATMHLVNPEYFALEYIMSLFGK